MDAPELDFAEQYYGILPAGFRGLKEDTIVFTKDCPEDIKKRVLEIWPTVKERVEQERKQGIWREVY